MFQRSYTMLPTSFCCASSHLAVKPHIMAAGGAVAVLASSGSDAGGDVDIQSGSSAGGGASGSTGAGGAAPGGGPVGSPSSALRSIAAMPLARTPYKFSKQ